MKRNEERVKDPVCGKRVNAHQREVEYLNRHFAFCSDQCRERFIAHPSLYVGRPGEKAPKQEGARMLKRRRMRLAEPLPKGKEPVLRQTLQDLAGVKQVKVAADSIEITYDLLESDLAHIETGIAQLGAKLGGDWLERLQKAFIHFEEEIEIDSLESSHGKSFWQAP